MDRERGATPRWVPERRSGRVRQVLARSPLRRALPAPQVEEHQAGDGKAAFLFADSMRIAPVIAQRAVAHFNCVPFGHT